MYFVDKRIGKFSGLHFGLIPHLTLFGVFVFSKWYKNIGMGDLR